MGPLRLFIFSGIEVLRQYWLSLVGKKKETNTYGKNALEEERVTLVNQLNNQNLLWKQMMHVIQWNIGEKESEREKEREREKESDEVQVTIG